MSDQGPWKPRPPGSTPQTPWNTPRPSGPTPPDFDKLADEARMWLRGLFAGRGGGGRGVLLAGLAIAAIWLATGFYRVQPDEQALVLRWGAFSRATAPGLNYHAPWPVESVITLPVTRINRVEIGFRSDATADTGDQAAADLADESLMLTGDENIIDINCSVFWRISDARAFAFNTRNPANTVKVAAESVLRQVIGRTPIQSALTEGRAAIEAGVTSGAQAIMDQYHSGIVITQVQLQKVDPPGDVVESFRDVQRATTDADRARNEAQAYANDIVPRARGDAAVITASAAGDKAASVAHAQGEAQAFLAIYAAYSQAKDVTLRRLYIETMQDILTHSKTTIVDDKLRGVLPLLKLGAEPDATP